MFCTKCGSKAASEWKHCPNCGAFIGNVPSSKVSDLSTNKSIHIPEELKVKQFTSQNSNKVKLQILLGIVVVSLIVFAAFSNFQASHIVIATASNLESTNNTSVNNSEKSAYTPDKKGLSKAAVSCTADVIKANDLAQQFIDLNQMAVFADSIYRAIGTCIPSKNSSFICWENEDGVPACNWDKNSVQGYFVSMLDGVDLALKAAGAQWLQN